MILDTNFLGFFRREREAGQNGPASAFLAARRNQQVMVTVITAGEIAVIFDSTAEARKFLSRFRILRLVPEIAYAAAEIDRELIAVGRRLSENDNWIAGFCRYYTQPLVSNDAAFDRVRGIRRLAY